MEKTETRKTFVQALRFAMVGVFNTVVDYSFFYFFMAMLSIHYTIAQVMATAVAMCGSYIVNRKWTFKRDGHGSVGEIARFVLVNLFSMLVVIFFTHLFYDILHIEGLINYLLETLNINFKISDDFAVMVSKACASVFSIILNFIGNKFWVFKKEA